MAMDSDPLRHVSTRRLKFYVFLFLWCIGIHYLYYAVLILTVKKVLFLIDYITITQLSTCFYVALLQIHRTRASRRARSVLCVCACVCVCVCVCSFVSVSVRVCLYEFPQNFWRINCILILRETTKA